MLGQRSGCDDDLCVSPALVIFVPCVTVENVASSAKAKFGALSPVLILISSVYPSLKYLGGMTK